jgi:predicted ATPase
VFDWIASWGAFRFRVLDLMKDLNDLALDRGPADSITTTGDNLARILYVWKTQPNVQALEAVSDTFRLILKRSGYESVSWDVKPEVAAGTVYLSVRLYKDDGSDKWHELAFGPDGLKAMLLLTCALNSNCPLVFLEEPELHFDPRLLDLVADVLVESAKSGKEIIFTTHSPILAQHIPVGSVRLLLGSALTRAPDSVKASQDTLVAWLTDALHERTTAP